MPPTTATYGAARVLHLDAAGPPIASEDDGRELLEQALGADADWVAVPAERLGDAFFALRTGFAGALVQRLRLYGCGLAVVGDVARHTAASESFRALVAEAGRDAGGALLFAADAASLGAALASRGA